MSKQVIKQMQRNNNRYVPSSIGKYAEKNWSLKATIAIGVITTFFSFGCPEKANKTSESTSGEARAASKVEKKEVKNPATEIFDGKTMSNTGQMQAKKLETKIKETKPDLKKVIPEKIELKGLPLRELGPGGGGYEPQPDVPTPKVKGRS